MRASRPSSAAGAARGAGEGFADSHAFEALARAGFISRGVVYAIIGVLALRLAPRTAARIPCKLYKAL